MTKEEAKAYARQLLKDSGASDEDVTQYLKLLDNEKFSQGFVPRPEVDRALSAEKSITQKLQQDNDYYVKDWFPKAKKTEEQANRILDRYRKYVELYGEIDEGNPDEVRRAATTSGITQEKLLEILNSEFDNRLAARDRATLDLMNIREDYMDRFHKRLPMNDLEKYVTEQRKSGNSDSLNAIYNSWIAPEVEKLTPHRFTEDELKARDKRITEEALKDFRSRNRVPVDSRPKEAHMLFDNAKLRADKEKANGNGGGKSAREAFLEVMDDPDPDTVKQRFRD